MASFRKKASGWQFRISYKVGNKYKEKSGSGFKTKKEAQIAATMIEKKLHDQVDIQAGEELFTEYYEQWVHTYKIGKFSPSTDRLYETAVNIVKQYFSGVKLNKITKMSYQKFINEYAKGRAYRSVKKVHHEVAASLRDAFKNGHIPIDVTYNIKLHGDKPTQKEVDKYLDEADAKKLLKALQADLELKNVNKYMCILQMTIGARIGEIMAITFDCIDFEKNTITINKTWDYKYTRSFAPTKNKKERTVSVDSSTMDLLHELYKDIRRRSFKSKIKNTNNLLFADRMMEPPSVEGTNKMLRKLCQEIGIKVVTSHNLRHTHASILLLHGLDLQYVADRLGDTPEVVSSVYAHLLQEMKDKGNQKASEIAALLYAK